VTERRLLSHVDEHHQRAAHATKLDILGLNALVTRLAIYKILLYKVALWLSYRTKSRVDFDEVGRPLVWAQGVVEHVTPE
jgi:hypothetical protein